MAQQRKQHLKPKQIYNSLENPAFIFGSLKGFRELIRIRGIRDVMKTYFTLHN